METQKFLDILDQYGIVASKFFEKHGQDIFTNKKLLLAILDLEWSEKKRTKLMRLAWIIVMDISAPNFGSKRHFINILPIYKYFHEYMYNACKFFRDKQIPWEEWEDLAKEQVDLLGVLVKENKLTDFANDKRYHDFCDKFDKREEELFNKGYTQLRDGMYR